MIDEENTQTIPNIIRMALEKKDETSTFIELCHILFIIKQDTKNEELTKKLLEEQTLMRKIRLVEAIKEETENKAHYYDNKHKTNKLLNYNEETETEITKIKLYLLKEIAEIIKEEGEEIEL